MAHVKSKWLFHVIVLYIFHLVLQSGPRLGSLPLKSFKYLGLAQRSVSVEVLKSGHDGKAETEDQEAKRPKGFCDKDKAQIRKIRRGAVMLHWWCITSAGNITMSAV